MIYPWTPDPLSEVDTDEWVQNVKAWIDVIYSMPIPKESRYVFIGYVYKVTRVSQQLRNKSK